MPEVNPVLEALIRTNALVSGHFALSAKDHSKTYVNIVALTSDVEELFKICQLMAPSFHTVAPDLFVCPADAANGLTACLALAYNQSRPKRSPKAGFVYASKKDQDNFEFRRNQGDRVAGKRCVVIDDVGTTGRSARKVVELLRAHGGQVEIVTYICIRGNLTLESLGRVPQLYAPLTLQFPTYPADQCPLCEEGIPLDVNLGHGREYRTEHSQTSPR